MLKKTLLVVVLVSFVFTLSGCDSLNSLFTPTDVAIVNAQNLGYTGSGSIYDYVNVEVKNSGGAGEFKFVIVDMDGSRSESSPIYIDANSYLNQEISLNPYTGTDGGTDKVLILSKQDGSYTVTDTWYPY